MTVLYKVVVNMLHMTINGGFVVSRCIYIYMQMGLFVCAFNLKQTSVKERPNECHHMCNNIFTPHKGWTIKEVQKRKTA